MRLLPLFVLLPLLGCPAEDKDDTSDTVDTSDDVVDADGDGYAIDDDCDDTNAAINPGATETCDGVDEDCDGDIDDGAGETEYYLDNDGDTYGDANGTPVVACEPPTGHTEDNTDCDDGDQGVNPGATEVCDAVDNDCDGEIDIAASDMVTYYADADGDGFGVSDSTFDSCQDPGAGWAEYDGDCDDTNILYNPGADESDCADPNDYNCDGSTGYADADGDGFAACEECDDANVANNPAATEVCDDADNNCDGTIDEATAVDASTWYADADADTFGDPLTSVIACDAPADHVADATDCDDASEAVNPGATELCNDLDDDCDTVVDESDAADASTWYADADVDTFGDASTTSVSCDQPEGFVADDTDCDDAEPDAYPGNDETCDSIDNDCDTEIDEDSAIDAVTWYADADDDAYGDVDSFSVSCEAPTDYIAAGGDCDDAAAAVNPGATETCNDVDDDCDDDIDESSASDASTWYADADDDTYGSLSSVAACDQPAGYVANNTDCDDTRATDRPGATEYCDTRDNDCDGDVDELAFDRTTFYVDSDNDTFGDPSTSTLACTAASGYVADNTDCDDTRSSVNPGAAEVCDDLDNDCDVSIDESAVDRDTFYADADNDTFGDAASTTLACTAPPGFVADSTDCDDGRATTFPGASERCDDLDNDCDSTIDESPIDPTTWYLDTDGDGFGDSSVSTATCDAPTAYVADDGDCDETDDAVNPGAAEVCGDSTDNDCDATTNCAPEGLVTSAADYRYDGAAASDAFGTGLAHGYGDYDGDGVYDFAIGAETFDTTGTNNRGRTYVFNGTSGTFPSVLASASTTISGGDDDGSRSGYALAWLPDIDGDGDDELLVASRLRNASSLTDAGSVFLMRGGTTGALLTTAAVTTFNGTTADDYLGSSLASGDVNDDGGVDVLIGATEWNAGTADAAGTAALFFGAASSTPFSTTETYTGADVVITGSAASDFLGESVAVLGDLDGDGADDLAVAAYGYDGSASNAGAVFVLHGGSGLSSSYTAATVDTVINGAVASDRFGYSLAALGDTDGDGYDDFAVGADNADNAAADAGAVYVFTDDPAAGSVSATTASAVITGARASDFAGRSLSGGCDVDGDATPDMLVAATGYDNGTTSGVGAVYWVTGPFVSGSLSAAPFQHGANASDAFGARVACIGDVNADGYDDTLGTSLAADYSASNSGSVWLSFGNGY